jgi:hypothetical protein
MFRLLCFATIRLLHYLLETYMCKSYNGWDILVISREIVAGNAVGMIRIISTFMTKWICSYVLCLVLHCCTVPRLHPSSSYRSFVPPICMRALNYLLLLCWLLHVLFLLVLPRYYVTYNCTAYRNLLFTCIHYIH